MKRFKLLGILTLGTVFAAVGLMTWATPASANNGPHGGYTLTTSACAGCHRAHTAVGADLLRETDVYALCTTCHSGVVQTNVVNGTRTGDGATLNSGGFEQVNGQPVTSSHEVEGLPVDGTPASGDDTAFGGASSGVGVSGTLECTSCHNPHGSSNFRILRDTTNGYPYTDAQCGGVPGCAAAAAKWVPNDPNLLTWVNYQVVATVDDNYDYAFVPASDCVGNKCKMYFTSGITANADHTYTVDTTHGMNAFCATCHKSYLTLSGSATNPSTDGTHYVYPGTQDANDGKGDVARYRHAMERTYTGSPKQPLRFAAEGTSPGTAGSVVYDAFGCLTCHFVHGSSSAADGYAAGVAPANDSALLFYDNRGVCISCHQTLGNPATVTPVPPTNTPVPPTATATTGP